MNLDMIDPYCGNFVPGENRWREMFTVVFFSLFFSPARMRFGLGLFVEVDDIIYFLFQRSSFIRIFGFLVMIRECYICIYFCVAITAASAAELLFQRVEKAKKGEGSTERTC